MSKEKRGRLAAFAEYEKHWSSVYSLGSLLSEVLVSDQPETKQIIYAYLGPLFILEHDQIKRFADNPQGIVKRLERELPELCTRLTRQQARYKTLHDLVFGDALSTEVVDTQTTAIDLKRLNEAMAQVRLLTEQKEASERIQNSMERGLRAARILATFFVFLDLEFAEVLHFSMMLGDVSFYDHTTVAFETSVGFWADAAKHSMTADDIKRGLYCADPKELTKPVSRVLVEIGLNVMDTGHVQYNPKGKGDTDHDGYYRRRISAADTSIGDTPNQILNSLANNRMAFSQCARLALDLDRFSNDWSRQIVYSEWSVIPPCQMLMILALHTTARYSCHFGGGVFASPTTVNEWAHLAHLATQRDDKSNKRIRRVLSPVSSASAASAAAIRVDSD